MVARRRAQENRARIRGTRAGISWGGILLILAVVVVVAIAALTSAGGEVDRMLSEVGTTLGPVPMGAGMSRGRPMALRGAPPPPPDTPANTEQYDRIDENSFQRVDDHPLSTFSVDVDTASYANVRRKLEGGSWPEADAVRIEELVNYFAYDYPEPGGKEPFTVQVETAAAPWNPAHRLARIGLRGRSIPADERKPANLVFLLDVSGSMGAPNKLPLLKDALAMLVNNLNDRDRVAVVVYAGASGLVLPSTRCGDRQRILQAMRELHAGGSTNAGSGIQLAYQVAKEHFIQGGVNRVILATDGDFNVGVSSRGDLTRLIEEKAKSGVFLTVLGLGMGNLKDSTLEELSRRGNGNYAYLDTKQEARKVMVQELGATLVTIAKDVKLQVEFNPAEVASYRLIGYENRLLAAEDFNDDTKDAGEMGAGHRVTALYELVPAGTPETSGAPKVDPLRYQSKPATTSEAGRGEIMTVKLRYKEPDGDTSKLLTLPVKDDGGAFATAPQDFRFAAAVAGFGMVLRASKHKGTVTLSQIEEIAAGARGADLHGYRKGFLALVQRSRELAPPPGSKPKPAHEAAGSP